jgi:hypothetical protein
VTLTLGCITGAFFVFGVVLLIPCLGLFICHLAVAGLALSYLSINFSLRFGHPSRKPRHIALRSVKIFGLHNDWCANLTPFALVLTECLKLATFATPSCASDGDVYFLICVCGHTARVGALVGASMIFVTCSIPVSMGSVNRSVDASLIPLKITFPLYQTSHFVLVNTTLHPAS